MHTPRYNTAGGHGLLTHYPRCTKILECSAQGPVRSSQSQSALYGVSKGAVSKWPALLCRAWFGKLGHACTLKFRSCAGYLSAPQDVLCPVDAYQKSILHTVP